jgi:hypothetical protein
MLEIGTKKFGSHIMNLLTTRSRMPINLGIGSLKRPIFNRTSTYNEVCLCIINTVKAAYLDHWFMLSAA